MAGGGAATGNSRDTPRVARVREHPVMYTRAMDYESSDRSAREAREHFADVINDAIRGRVTYITSNGRRVAAIVPLAVAEALAGHSGAGQVSS